MDVLRSGCAFLFVLICPIVVPQTATAPAHHPGYETSSHSQSKSAHEIWSQLMAGNRRFVEAKPQTRQIQSLRSSLAKGQHPIAIVLACSDSRVAPELIFDQDLGQLFVVRSAGNIADAIGLGSIEYAVEHLGSTVLIVLGHTKCGAVIAACSGEKMPTSNLQAIMDQIDPAVAAAKRSGAKDDAMVEAAIRQNVHTSAQDVLAHSDLLRHLVEKGHLTVLEAEYQLDTGEVVRLDGTAQQH